MRIWSVIELALLFCDEECYLARMRGIQILFHMPHKYLVWTMRELKITELLVFFRGLDSSSSAQCVRLLQNLAREGRTIVCTIHQPSATIYNTFDHVYIMAEGQCVYQGSADNTVAYLSSLGLYCPQYHSPADYSEFS